MAPAFMPDRSMSFAQACREADKKRRRKPEDRRIERLRRLMVDGVSVDNAWRELNGRPSVRLATLYAAEFLLQIGDVPRWRRWFDAHTADERAGILRHLKG